MNLGQLLNHSLSRQIHGVLPTAECAAATLAVCVIETPCLQRPVYQSPHRVNEGWQVTAESPYR